MTRIHESTKGFSIIQVLVAIGLMAILASVFLTLTVNQHREMRILQETMARAELEPTLLKALSSSAVCSFLMADPSQSSVASSPNRSVDTINATTDDTLKAQVVKLRKIPAGAAATAPLLAEVGKRASPNSSGLIIDEMAFSNFKRIGVDQFLADFTVSFKPPPLTILPVKPIILSNIFFTGDAATVAATKAITSCSAPKGEAPQLIRKYFTADTVPVAGDTWTVPPGVKSALVTIAGGGGTGYGWRVVNALKTGDSGGYLVSYPITLIPGEKYLIRVGRGGISHMPSVGFPNSAPGCPGDVLTAPVAVGEDGLGGYNGTSSSITRISTGSTVIECAGGSGATTGGIDFWHDGSTVDRPLMYVPGTGGEGYYGAHIGSSTPDGTIAFAKRDAPGPYGRPNAPGTCGPVPPEIHSVFGGGAPGQSFFTASGARLNSGFWPGGQLSIGHGSGGDVSVNGCYIVNSCLIVPCVYTRPGQNGVVIIDMLY